MSRPVLSRLARQLGLDEPLNEGRRAWLLGATAACLAPRAAIASPRASGRLVVLGAGFAGLAAAHEGQRLGFDVTVLEARQRLGGRVLSLSADGQVHEGGAELIGDNHPLWLSYAERFGLRLRPIAGERGEEPVALEGRVLSARDARRAWKPVAEAMRALTRASVGVDPSAPWDAPDAATLDATSVQAWLDAEGLDPTGLFSRLMAGDAGLPMRDASLLGLLGTIQGGGGRRFWTHSEVYRCEGGNQRLAEAFAAAIGPDRIWRGSPVVAVEHGADGVRVTLADGRTVEADAAICALPPPTWRQIRFEPGLPATLAPPMGHVVKQLTRLSRPVWRDSGRAPDGVGDDLTVYTWDGTDGQPGEARWLVAFTGAEPAITASTLPKEARDARFDAELSRLFPGFADAVVERRFYDWPSEPFTGAGYTTPSVGGVTTTYRALSAGIGRLGFAGEHASVAFAGYMEGALQTGVSAAQRAAQAG